MSTTNNTQATTATTKTTPKRPEGFTKHAWDTSTYAAYLDLVKVVSRSVSIADYLTAHAALFTNAGVPADEPTVISLVIAMAKDTTKAHEKVRHINPISQLRAFFNGGWKDRAALRIDYKAPTAPKKSEPKPKKSKQDTMVDWFNGMSAEERQALLAALTGQSAA